MRVSLQRHLQRRRMLHCLCHQLPDRLRLRVCDLHEQLVMHLKYDPRVISALREPPVHLVHRYLHDIRRCSLYRRVHRHPFSELTRHEIACRQLRYRSPAPVYGSHVAMLPGLSYLFVQICLDLRICLKIVVDIVLSLLFRDAQSR